jgi:hypothetical protein
MTYSHFRKPTLISLILMLCLLIPSISFSKINNTERHNGASRTHTSQESIKTKTEQPYKKKAVLSADRDLGPFFIIGLAINLIMMTTFSFWAYGQWKQLNKKNKK